MTTFVPITDNKLRVKHGAQIRVDYFSGPRELGSDLVPVEQLGGHLTVKAVMHGGVSGHVHWHDKDGPLPRGIQYQLFIDQDMLLTGDQLCDCPKCEA